MLREVTLENIQSSERFSGWSTCFRVRGVNKLVFRLRSINKLEFITNSDYLLVCRQTVMYFLSLTELMFNVGFTQYSFIHSLSPLHIYFVSFIGCTTHMIWSHRKLGEVHRLVDRTAGSKRYNIPIYTYYLYLQAALSGGMKLCGGSILPTRWSCIL